MSHSSGGQEILVRQVRPVLLRESPSHQATRPWSCRASSLKTIWRGSGPDFRAEKRGRFFLRRTRGFAERTSAPSRSSRMEMILPSFLSHSTRRSVRSAPPVPPVGDPRQPARPDDLPSAFSPASTCTAMIKGLLASGSPEASRTPRPLAEEKPPASFRPFGDPVGKGAQEETGDQRRLFPAAVPGSGFRLLKAARATRSTARRAQGSAAGELLCFPPVPQQVEPFAESRSFSRAPSGRMPDGGGCPAPKGGPPGRRRGEGIRVRRPFQETAEPGMERQPGHRPADRVMAP